MFREIGLPYAKMEENGIMLPLIDLHCNYKQSAKYDDELTIVTTLDEMPNIKIRFNYKIYNSENTLLCDGYTTLVFIDTQRNRPTRMPDYIKELIEPYFQSN
jgi:acyl-CoA thioester hydrolase